MSQVSTTASPEASDLGMTNRVIETDATPEQIDELLEQMRLEHPTLRSPIGTTSSRARRGASSSTTQGTGAPPRPVSRCEAIRGRVRAVHDRRRADPGRIGAPTVLLSDLDGLELGAVEMHQLAEHATEAAEWLTKNS